MTSRREFLTTLTGLACLPWLPACSTANRPVHLGLHVWPGYEPLPLARTMGWLDQKLVRITQTSSATDSLAWLAAGTIDGAGLTLDEVLRARENGIPLTVLLVCDISAGADLLLARQDISRLADLRGRRIAVEDGALGALMLHEALQRAQLQPRDVITVSAPVDQHAALWKQGAVDAAVTYDPAASSILGMGGIRLFDSRLIPDTVVDVLAVRSGLLDPAHDQALRHIVEQHLRALQFINTSPDDASYRMAPRFGLPASQVMSAFRGLVLPDLDNNRRLLESTPPALQLSAARISSILVSAGLLKKPAPLEGLVSARYLPRPEF